MCSAVFLVSKGKTLVSKGKGITLFGLKFCVCGEMAGIKREGDNFFIHRVLGTSFEPLEGGWKAPILALGQG